MPYDPTRLGGDGAREQLTVQVQGARGEPERVFVLGRPRNDLVEVREFGSSCAPAAPRDYTETTHDMLRLFEKAARQKRRVSQELYLIRQWLNG